MLRSVVSNTYKDRKYPGRFGRGQEVAEEGDLHDDEDIDLMKLSKWKRPEAKQNQVGLTQKDIDEMKGLSAEEQIRKLSNVFNFYAMDNNNAYSSAGETTT